MANVLISLSGNQFTQSDTFKLFPFYEGLLKSLVRNGNNVYYMIVNEFVNSYTSRSNLISSKIDQDKLDSYIKKINPDLIISFNNACYRGIAQKLDCPYLVWGVDPISVYADKEDLTRNKSRYIFVGNNEDDCHNIKNYFNVKNVEILRFATDIFAENIRQDIPISFVGSLWNGCELDLLEKGVSSQEIKKIVELLRTNTNFTLEDLKKQSKLSLPYLNDESIFWLLHGIASNDRAKVLTALSDLGLEIYGNNHNWIKTAENNLDLALCYNRREVYDLKSTQTLFNRSEICFNMSHIHARGNGFSFRVLDAMASNGCLVTDYKECYKKLFGNYVDLPTFKYGDASDARNVCEYILKHDKERKEIVQGAQKAINAEYRFENRFAQIESFINIKLLNKSNNGTIKRIEAQNFLKRDSKQIPTPLFGQKEKKKKSIFMKIITYPERLRKKAFKPIYTKYFSQIPNSLNAGFTFCEKSFKMVSSVIVDFSLSFKYQSYHDIIDKEAYIARVSKGFPKRKQNGKIKIVFLFQEAAYWPSVETLYNELKNDARFEVFVIAIPCITLPELSTLELKDHQIQFLIEKGIDYIDARQANGSFFDPFTLSPDYVFVQIHFDRQRVLEYKTSILSLYTKVCLIPHAFLLSQSDNKELIHQSHYFKVFVPNRIHAKILENVFHHKDNIEVTGYPRFDLYNKVITDSKLWKIPKKTKGTKRIIWSPHWWAYGHSKGLFDDLMSLWDYFYRFLLLHKEVELVIKPHPSLLNGIVAAGYISEEKLKILMEKMNALPNASIYQGGQYFDLFQTADGMINNSISFLAEWLPSKKPMLFVNTERKFELNEIAEKILKVYYKASSLSDVHDFIDKVILCNQDKLKEKRIALIKEFSLFDKESAAIKIKKSLLDNIDN